MIWVAGYDEEKHEDIGTALHPEQREGGDVEVLHTRQSTVV